MQNEKSGRVMGRHEFGSRERSCPCRPSGSKSSLPASGAGPVRALQHLPGWKIEHRPCGGAGPGTVWSDDLHGPCSPMQALTTGQGGDGDGLTTWDGDPPQSSSAPLWGLPVGPTFPERCWDAEGLPGSQRCSELEDLPGTSLDLEFEKPHSVDSATEYMEMTSPFHQC